MLVTQDNYAEAMRDVARQEVLFVDTETDGLWPYQGNRLVGISVLASRSYYFPFRHGEGPNLDEQQLAWLVELIQAVPVWVGWNSKYDLHILTQDGYELPTVPAEGPSPVEDAMNLAWLCNENEPTFGLKQLSRKHFGAEAGRDEEELRETIEREYKVELRILRAQNPRAKDGLWKGLMWKLPAEVVEPYACSDVELTARMRRTKLEELVDRWHIDPALYDELNHYTLLFAHMEKVGIQLDTSRLEHLADQVEPRQRAIEQQIEQLSGGLITKSNSSAQINKFLGRDSTRADHLKTTLANHPLSPLLLEYRSLKKLETSYLYPYRRFMDREAVVHTSFNPIGTYTGRVACRDPALQAIPRQVGEEGIWVDRVKELFVARPGYVLMEWDFSQAELRIASHYGAKTLYSDPRFRQLVLPVRYDDQGRIVEAGRLGGDCPDGWDLLSPMGQILVSGKDLHQETADRIKTDRSTAKRVNFSAVFGIGPKSYHEKYHVPLPQAAKNLGSWHHAFPEFRHLLNRMQAVAEKRGYILLDSGRIRRYTGAKPEYHKASSNLVQGTVADATRKAQLVVHQFLASIGGRLLLQVHDSLVMEVPEELVFEAAQQVRRSMTGFAFSPRLDAEGKVGCRWSELKSIGEGK